MKGHQKQRFLIIAMILALMLVSFSAGNVTGFLVRPVLAADEPAEFSIFWEAWDLVTDNFVDQEMIDFQSMTYGAIRGMLATLGDENHTVFFSPEEAEQQQSSLEGSFEGIGAYVAIEEGFFTIVAPIHGSPAEEAGILAGDIVLEVDGEEITGMPQWEVISKIRGPAGSTVTLTVLHPDESDSVDIEITRGRIDVSSVLWTRIPESDLAYLQITQFAADTSRELRTALEEIQATTGTDAPINGIILDLRNNPGGYLQEALRVGSQFLPEDEVILHERDAKDNVTTYRSRGSGLAREIPMVVMINQGSASAAEILSGALQDNGRAKLVGDITLGTGTVLRPYTLSDGSVMRLGVTNWLTPDFELIKNEGIAPDVKIEQEASVQMIDSFSLETMNRDDLFRHEDRQFSTALLLLRVAVREAADASVLTPAD